MPAPSHSVKTKSRILLVEDETHLRKSLQRGLMALSGDLEVIGSPSAEDAEKIFRETHFELLVTDLILPGKNGLELIKIIKKLSPDTICIIITAAADVDSTLKALQNGVDNFLKKPISINELHLIIQKSIREKTFHRQHLEIQQNFIDFLNSTPDGMIICSLDDLILFSNESAARLTGYTMKDLLNLNITEIIMPTPPVGQINAVSTSSLNESSDKSYFSLVTNDGGKKYIDVTSTRIAWFGQQAVLYNFRDITDRMKIESQVKKAKHLYESLFDNVHLGLFRSEYGGRIIKVNQYLYRLLGYDSKEELLKVNTADLYASAERRQELINQIRENRSVEDEEVLFNKKDGTQIWISLSGHIGKTETGNIFYDGYIKDISQQKIIKEKLEISLERFKFLAENVTDAIFIIARDGQILFYNGHAGYYFQIMKDKYSSPNIFNWPDTKTTRLLKFGLKKILNSHKPLRKQTKLKVQKKVLWLDTHLSPVKNRDGEIELIFGITRDITLLKETEKKLESLSSNLEQRLQEELNKQKSQQQALIQKSKLESLGELSSGMAHEINQPLASISMGLENILIKNSKGIDSAYLKSKCESMLEDVARVENIIDHIKIFSRDQKIGLIDQIDVNKTLESAFGLLQAQFKNHGITVKFKFDNDVGPVIGNQYQLEQVFLNIFSNAKYAVEEKYFSATEPNYAMSIDVETRKKGDKIVVSIKDNGTGISDENLKKIFDPFFTTKEPGKGTGMGLAVSYGIINEMNGELRVESKPGCYTIIRTTLPILPEKLAKR